MTPESMELLRQTEADVHEQAARAGTRPDFAVVRLKPDVHDTLIEQVRPCWADIQEGQALVFAGFNVTRGPEDMVEVWRFWRSEDLPRRKATKINRDKH